MVSDLEFLIHKVLWTSCLFSVPCHTSTALPCKTIIDPLTTDGNVFTIETWAYIKKNDGCKRLVRFFLNHCLISRLFAVDNFWIIHGSHIRNMRKLPQFNSDFQIFRSGHTHNSPTTLHRGAAGNNEIWGAKTGEMPAFLLRCRAAHYWRLASQNPL